jgi:hypothetical protein
MMIQYINKNHYIMESLGEIGNIVALFLHSDKANMPMLEAESLSLIANEGILNNTRYYKVITKRGTPNKRHVSIIEEEMIDIHKKKLNSQNATNVDNITLNSVRSNIITNGIDLVKLVGKSIAIGDTAIVKFSNKRDPCYKMDNLCKGLLKEMLNGKQGVVAEIIVSGNVRIGDTIRVI